MKNYDITSGQNDTYKIFLELLGSKGIGEHGQALVFGRKATQEVLEAHPDRCMGWILCNESDDGVLKGGLSRYRLDENLFKKLDVFGIRQPILLVKAEKFQAWSPQQNPSGCELVLPFQDPGNLGTALRTAAAFGVKRVILPEGAAHPFHPRSSRAASGTIFSFEFFRAGPLAALDFGSHSTVALDLKGEDLSKFTFPSDFFLLAGSEGQGMPPSIKPTHKVNIRMEGAESLNAAVATSIALYQWACSTHS